MYNKVYIEITNVCNMNCSFCHGTKRTPRQMTKAEFSNIASKLKSQTKYLYYHLLGEPLIHPLLLEFLTIAKNEGFKSIITTNGTLLNERGDDILNAGVHKINVSLHSYEGGAESEHAKYISDIASFAKRASGLGVIIVFRLWNNGFDKKVTNATLSLLKNYLGDNWVENSRGVKISDNIYLEWGKRFEWPDINENIKGEKFFCYGLKDQFGILVDGTVVPCCLDCDGVINLGNIYKEDIESILNSKRAKDIVNGFRLGVASEELCKKCGYAQRFIK